MPPSEPTVLLISADPALCTAVRSALEQGRAVCHVASVATFAAARRSVTDFSPDVIVLEESALTFPHEISGRSHSALEDVVSALAGFAPVVVLGGLQAPAGLSALIAAGAADFVADSGSRLPAAAACVEKRLRNARRLQPESLADASRQIPYLEGFGEILRHELNNPLTGILGNAELLLAESRRQNHGAVSESGVKRLETIAALAVRMRETVRRLSQVCESRVEQNHTA